MASLWPFFITLTLGMTLTLTSGERTIRVLKSSLAMEEDGYGISGAKLVTDRWSMDVETKDLTICLRFKYQRLGGHEGRSRLVTIGDWRDDDVVSVNFDLFLN